MKLTQSLNIGLHWDTNQLRQTRRHSNGNGLQLSMRLYSVHQNRRVAQSSNLHCDGCSRSLRRLDYCLLNCPGWDPIGWQYPADRRCPSIWPRKPPCTPVSMRGYCPIRCPSSTFVSFQRWSMSTPRSTTSVDATGLHSIFEPVDLDRDDGRIPDEVTSFALICGKALAWDSNSTDSFSASNPHITILNPESASGAAEDLKRRKYPQLVADFEFVPVTVETSGIIGSAGCSLQTDIGRRISRATNDPVRRLTSFNRFQSPSS